MKGEGYGGGSGKSTHEERGGNAGVKEVIPWARNVWETRGVSTGGGKGIRGRSFATRGGSSCKWFKQLGDSKGENKGRCRTDLRDERNRKVLSGENSH